MGKLPLEGFERQILVKKPGETDINFGCSPEKRTTETLLKYSIINIDKSEGPTSHQVSDYVQRILGIKKAGHSGTLDPGVTGVLPVAIGRATRIVQVLLPAGKEYVCLIYFHKEISDSEAKDVLKSFEGKIIQLPPVKSAVKRQERERKIYYIETLEIEGQNVLFRVGCQAGTYIRKLCHDLGKKAGTGAHMVELRRTKASSFDESTLVTLDDLRDAFWYYKNEGNETYLRKILMPVEHAVEFMPKIWVFDSAIEPICHGVNLAVPGVSKLNNFVDGDKVAIMSLKEELIAIGTAKMMTDKILNTNKGIAVKVEKVFMEPGVYPSLKKSE